MTSVRNQVLNQVCLTPKKTVKQLAYALNIAESQVRLAEQDDKKVVKREEWSGSRLPLRYVPIATSLITLSK